MTVLHNAAAVLFAVGGVLALVDLVFKQAPTIVTVVGLLLACIAGLVLALA
jgi:hypothetical protein